MGDPAPVFPAGICAATKPRCVFPAEGLELPTLTKRVPPWALVSSREAVGGLEPFSPRPWGLS